VHQISSAIDAAKLHVLNSRIASDSDKGSNQKITVLPLLSTVVTEKVVWNLLLLLVLTQEDLLNSVQQANDHVKAFGVVLWKLMQGTF